ncbi:hypothetical protein ACFQ2B_31365 [Streptomyces stramineus]
MMRQAHKRSQLKNRAVVSAAALLLGGGGTAIIAANASAGPDGAGHRSGGAARTAAEGSATTAPTVVCPDVGDRLREVPAPVRTEVSQSLSQLDAQVARAYERMATRGDTPAAVLAELKDKRAETIGRITDALGTAAGGSAPAAEEQAGLPHWPGAAPGRSARPPRTTPPAP